MESERSRGLPSMVMTLWLLALSIAVLFLFTGAEGRSSDPGEVAFGAPGSDGPVVRLTGAMPDPRVGGRTYPRSVTVSGLQFMDFEGNEMGGLGTIADGRRGMILCFDHETAEAACLTRVGDDVTFAIMEPPPPGAEVGTTGPQRFGFGVDAEEGLSYLHLMDREGVVRIRLQVDSAGTPRIETLGSGGEVLFTTARP